MKALTTTQFANELTMRRLGFGGPETSAEARDSRKCFIKPFYINYVIHIRGHIHISYNTLKVMKTSLFE